MENNIKFHFETFGIQYTNRCNYSCAHCAAGSSYRVINDNIGLEFMLSVIDGIKNTGFKEIALTGGECLIFKKDIFQIIKKAVSQNLRVKLVTNGFWVADNHLLENISKALVACGLNKLIFSIDKFHQQFTKLETLISAIDYITRKFPEMEVEIYTVKLGKKDKEQEQILSIIKDRLNNLNIFSQKLLPYGRAKKLPEALFLHMDRDNLKTPCDQVFSPFIDHEKNLYYCSNAYVLGERSPLFVKKIQTCSDLKLQIEKLKESILLKSLSTVGPIEIFGPPEPEKEFISICEFCLANMGRPESYEIIDNFTNKNRLAFCEIFESVKNALSQKK